jgi:hypothetical protein
VALSGHAPIFSDHRKTARLARHGRPSRLGIAEQGSPVVNALLIASFATHEVYQKLAGSGADGSAELAMVTKLWRSIPHLTLLEVVSARSMTK